MLGQGSRYAQEAFENNFVGVGWLDEINFTGKAPDNWRKFNEKYIPVYLERHLDKSKIAAGLACGMLYTIIKGISQGDIVICPDGEGKYLVGEVIGDYEYNYNKNLPHCRPVRWCNSKIKKEEMSKSLQNSAGAKGTVINISKYGEEIESLILGKKPPSGIATETIEDDSVFALETHLEEFLVQNWQRTKIGKEYDIYTENGEIIGQQFPTDTGPIDILAVSKDGKKLLVVELKKGRSIDAVVGQIQRYMGYVKDELAKDEQEVCGVIIAFEDDVKIQRALSVASGIEFYTYTVNFTLHKKK